MSPLLIIVVAVCIPIFLGLKMALRNMKRERLKRSPLPREWLDIIKRNIALYNYIPDSLKDELHGHVQVMLSEKHFEGCGGLTLTDEIKVTIAAQAAILLLNRKARYFPMVDAILVYPHAYVAEEYSEIGYNIKEQSARLGESWTGGVVVLAWDHVRQRTVDFESGHNVVLHEFAHQLDQEDGKGDGVPVLGKWSSYATWGRVLGKEYDILRDEVSHHKKDVMDAYGATNPAEFFAVATETFFEKAKAMKEKHPALYEQLKNYYRLDPAEWF